MDHANTAPRRADAERNRARLLRAAREVFTERGLDVTLDDVARHAGVGVGTAYRNFANKDALIDDLLVERMSEVVAVARDCLSESDPWLALRGFLDRALAMQVEDRGLKQVLFAEGRGHVRVDAARRDLAPVVAELVARARAAGVVRPDVDTTDVPLINLMVGTVIDFSRDLNPLLYRRYLELLLLGLRARDPLPAPALELPHFEQAMRRWHSR